MTKHNRLVNIARALAKLLGIGAYTSRILENIKSSRLALLLIFFTASSLFAFAQEISVGEIQKVKRKSAVIYSQYTTNAQLSFSVSNIKEVKMSTGAGKLEVKPSESGEVEIEAVIENRSLSKKKAQKFIEKYLCLSMEDINGKLEIKSFFEGTLNKWKSKRFGLGHLIETPGSKIHIILKVPKDIELSLFDRSGPIYLHDLENDIFIRDHSGRMRVENTKGNLDIVDGSGRLWVANHEGDLKIKDASGRMYLQGIGMDKKQYQLKIIDASGKIKAEGIGGDVSIKDASGEIELTNISGSIQLKDRSGHITLKEVGKAVELNDTSGGIDLVDIASMQFTNGDISIKDTSGGIYLKNAGTSAKIYDKSGRITVRDIQGDLTIDDRSGGISAKSVSGTIYIKDRSGRVSAEKYLVKNQ